jgi:hypothetical protein
MIGLSRHLTYVEISDPTPPDARRSLPAWVVTIKVRMPGAGAPSSSRPRSGSAHKGRWLPDICGRRRIHAPGRSGEAAVSHHDGVCRCPEAPHNETVRFVEAADIASPRFACDFVSHYAVNRGPANSGLETVLRLRRTGPQLSLVRGSRPSFRSP